MDNLSDLIDVLEYLIGKDIADSLKVLELDVGIYRNLSLPLSRISIVTKTLIPIFDPHIRISFLPNLLDIPRYDLAAYLASTYGQQGCDPYYYI